MLIFYNINFTHQAYGLEPAEGFGETEAAGTSTSTNRIGSPMAGLMSVERREYENVS